LEKTVMDMLTYWLYRIVSAVIGRLPLRTGIRIGRAIGAAGYHLLPGYRGIAMRNLGIAFPEKSTGGRRAIARKHFSTLIGNLFASEKLTRMKHGDILTLVDVQGLDHLRRLASRKRGFVLMISHIGNWELLAQLSPGLFQVPCGVVFQRLGNPYIDAHVRRTRARLGLTLFERKDGFHKAIAMLAAGGGVGVLMDQHAGDAGVWCPLFGRLASTSPLAATLSLRSGAAIVPVTMNTDGLGRWRMLIEPPIDPVSSDSGEATAQLQFALEKQICRQPDDWFWVHNRWKTPKPRFLLARYKRGIASIPTHASGKAPGPGAGELFAYAAENITDAPPNHPFRILIRSSNWLGDAVMSVPAVRAIKQGRPDAHVTVLTPAKLADVWKLVPEVDAVIAIAAPGGSGWVRKLRGALHVFEVAGLIKNGGYEAAVLFPNSLRVAVEAWIARIPRRVGYPGHAPRSLMLNQVFPTNKRSGKPPATGPSAHQVHHYLKLAEFIGAEIRGGQDFGFPAPASVSGSPVRIAVCPGAEYGPAKRWLPERFAEVIRALGEGFSCQWLLVGTEKDRPVAGEIAKLAGSPPNVENLCGKTTIAELIDLLRQCRLLVTNDTGTMHLAALLGVRTVAIFGSTEPTLTGPLGSGSVVLRRQVECSPCFLRECPIDFRCMKAVESAYVIAAIRSIVGATPPGSSDRPSQKDAPAERADVLK
jgi:lipopolysaccharide heptosyltransferase II